MQSGLGVVQVRRIAIALMKLVVISVTLGMIGCSIVDTESTQTEGKSVVGSTRQDRALKARIDNLRWSWKSQTTPMDGGTGAFTIELELTITNAGRYNLHPPRISVSDGGLVSWYQAGCREDMIHGQECKLRIAHRNQVQLEFNNNDPGKEILLTVEATDKKGELYTLSFTLPPPIEMPR
jgi:hypothetical protein